DRRSYAGNVRETINDLSLAKDNLFILSASIGLSGSHTLHKVPFVNFLSAASTNITIRGADHPTFGTMHMMAGGGLIFVGAADDNAINQVPGVEIFADTGTNLVLIGPSSPVTAFDIAPNGSGLCLFTGASA